VKIYQRKPAIVITRKTGLPVRYYFVYLLILIPYLCAGQITAPAAGTVRFTSYPSSPGRKDPVYIWCNPTGIQKGSLIAESPGGTGPFSFSWYKWSDVTKNFTIFIKTDPSALSSTIPSLDEGGYKVDISDGAGYDTSFVAWVHLDRPYADAKLQNYTCDYVALNGTAAIDTFYYRDPSGGAAVKLKNGFRFLWSSNPPSTIPNPSIEIDPITYIPPLEDVIYKLQVTDSFLCVNESSFPYTSIHVKAEFSFNPASGEAPLEVTITDNSVRAYKYKWEFGDDSVSELPNPPPHIYYRPGQYRVKLSIESDKHCTDVADSTTFDNLIKVDYSELDVPNVFTPDGDGLNDYFVVQETSLRKISVEIFSRSGLKVYTFSGEGQALDDWKGWDGNVNNTSSKAAPGVYFYVIRGLGWDDKPYDGKEYRGFLHLYR
jgi:gliding motility-associated-like protein